jgi:hypothetical protein
LPEPAGDDELATLRRLGLEGRARMACVCRPLQGGVTIDSKMNPRDLPEPVAKAPEVDLGVETCIQKVVIIGNGTAGNDRRVGDQAAIAVVPDRRARARKRAAL